MTKILFLPPAPHTGAFFDTVRTALSDLDSHAATYPGYGDMPTIGGASIEGYAKALQESAQVKTLIGFHTGCLVAIEMALQSKAVGKLILIDVPNFDQETRHKYAAGLDPDDPKHDAFRAAFAYDLNAAMAKLDHDVTCIATESTLFEPTVKTASGIKNCQLIERRDITKPALENTLMHGLIRELCL